MSYKEKDILFEGEFAWVLSEKTVYTVLCKGITNSVSDSSYAKTEDGLSIANARAKYLEKRKSEK